MTLNVLTPFYTVNKRIIAKFGIGLDYRISNFGGSSFWWKTFYGFHAAYSGKMFDENRGMKRYVLINDL